MIYTNHPIGDHFTWRLDVRARYFARVETVGELRAVLTSPEFKSCSKHFVLGKGANTLFADSYYDGFVLQIGLKGISETINFQLSTFNYYQVAAGEDWHETVRHFVFDLDLGGMENLAYIPGTFGAAAIQNVGAYGQTFEDVFVELQAMDIFTRDMVTFSKQQAQFQYRNSYFKSSDFRSRYIIVSTTVKLSPVGHHTIATGYHSRYESLHSELPPKGPYTIQTMFDAVTRLRQKKLPDIKDVGTNGSLFVNPIVSGTKLHELLVKFPQLQYYPADKMLYPEAASYKLQATSQYKFAAGHIFDILGWKGRMVGQVGTWRDHALVLCNYGTRDPQDVLKVIRMMQDDFEAATGIRLMPEINIVT